MKKLLTLLFAASMLLGVAVAQEAGSTAAPSNQKMSKSEKKAAKKEKKANKKAAKKAKKEAKSTSQK
jgi:hypothetical protein